MTRGMGIGAHDLSYQAVALGLIIEGAPEIGRLKRCKVEGDRGRKQSGWYIVHEMRLESGELVQVGAFGNWKTGDSERLKYNLPPMTALDKKRYWEQVEAQRAVSDAEREKAAALAASRARRIWDSLPESGVSEYLARKKVRAFGLRFTRGSIVVPVHKIDGALAGLQFIAADGSKKFLTGTAKRGAFHLIGAPVDGDPVVLVEGYATGASVHQATGLAVVVAFDAGNLLPVAQALRGHLPSSRFIVGADDDDAGRKAAQAVRDAVGAVVVLPDFSRAA